MPTNKKVVWSSNDESVATVDGSGVVTPQSQGDVGITVKWEEDEAISDSIQITVDGISLISLDYPPNVLSATIGSVS